MSVLKNVTSKVGLNGLNYITNLKSFELNKVLEDLWNEDIIDDKEDKNLIDNLLEFNKQYHNKLFVTYIDLELPISKEVGNVNVNYIGSAFYGDYCNYLIMGESKDIVDEVLNVTN
jgi:hypothetical protein